MIIQVLANLKDEGYLDKGRHPTVAPFFAGANVAFRRVAIEEIGGFDPACMTGEDCDLCARLSAADKELYMRRQAIIAHNNPSTFKRLVEQWYGYGRYHPYVFSKHNDRAVEVYVRLGLPLEGERYICLFYRRSPVGIVFFITKFLFMHIALISALVAALLGWGNLAWIAAGMAALAGLAYVWPEVRRHGILLGLAFTAIRYVADTALFAGALIGGLHQRMLYLSATMD
jgi:cellulose synthase/poly-beta-1,6-N-acetylglucosamine synthase-like glycosyltransferase